MQRVYELNSVSFFNKSGLMNFSGANKPVNTDGIKVDNKSNPFIIKDTVEISAKEAEKGYKMADKDKLYFKDVAIGLLESIPFVRRYISIEDGKEKNDNLKTFAATLLLLANAPEDARDLKAGINQFLHPKKVASGLSHDYQVKFSFLRGTLFEFLLKSKGKYTKKISEFLYDIDKTLFDTDLGQKALSLFKCAVDDQKPTPRKDIMKKAVQAFKFSDKPKLRWIIGRASLRITLLSILVFSALELPQIIKAFQNGNDLTDKLSNGFKQTLKSFVNVSVILLSTALFGAIFAQKGPAGSLFGIGTGAYLGSKISKSINQSFN